MPIAYVKPRIMQVNIIFKTANRPTHWFIMYKKTLKNKDSR